MKQNALNTLSKYKNKQETAYEEIKNAIILCHLNPGDQIIIRSVSAQLGISEIPVREAIKRLISENFIVEKNSSLLVSQISPASFLDMLEVKLDLELLAIKITAKKITDEQIDCLNNILKSMEHYLAINDIEHYKSEHHQFHSKTYEFCGVSYLISAISSAFSHHDRAINFFNLKIWETDPSLEVHSNILKALIDRNPDMAKYHLYENKIKAFDLYRKQITTILQAPALFP